MTMSDCHFKLTVTRCTQGDKVLHNVCCILIGIVAAWVNMMNVKRPSAFTALNPTVCAPIIADNYSKSNALPILAVVFTLSSLPVWTIFPSHVFKRTFLRTVFAAIGNSRRKGIKLLPTIRASQGGVFAGAFVLAFSTAIVRERVIKLFTATLTDSNALILFSVFSVAFTRAKEAYSIWSNATWYSMKTFPTIRTGQ